MVFCSLSDSLLSKLEIVELESFGNDAHSRFWADVSGGILSPVGGIFLLKGSNGLLLHSY